MTFFPWLKVSKDTAFMFQETKHQCEEGRQLLLNLLKSYWKHIFWKKDTDETLYIK